MKTLRIRISIDSDMQAFQFFENLSHASAFKKHNEIRKLIEAGYQALQSQIHLQQGVNSTPIQQSPIAHPLKVQLAHTEQVHQTKDVPAKTSEGIEVISHATTADRQKLLSLMSSAVKSN